MWPVSRKESCQYPPLFSCAHHTPTASSSSLAYRTQCQCLPGSQGQWFGPPFWLSMSHCLTPQTCASMTMSVIHSAAFIRLASAQNSPSLTTNSTDSRVAPMALNKGDIPCSVRSTYKPSLSLLTLFHQTNVTALAGTAIPRATRGVPGRSVCTTAQRLSVDGFYVMGECSSSPRGSLHLHLSVRVEITPLSKKPAHSGMAKKSCYCCLV